jgi:predicted ATPase
MITKLRVSNFRSLGREVEIELGSMTALVGANGAGKSNIADALRFMADCVTSSPAHALAARQGIRSLLRRGAGDGAVVECRIEGKDDRGEGVWEFIIRAGESEDAFCVANEHSGRPGEILASAAASKNNSTSVSGPRVPTLAEALRSLAIYSLFPNRLRAPQSPNPTKPMLGTGDNWASTLKSLDKRTAGSELIAGLQKLVGDIDDYRVQQAGGFLIPEFRHGADDRWLGAAQESDGTLRVAAMLTALFQEPPPALIGFEEPELAVHPGALPVLYDFLREASARSQILITTHSSDLLDLLPIDDIRVVERRDGVTTAARVEERQRDLVRRHLLSPSELLYAEGLRAEGARDDG